MDVKAPQGMLCLFDQVENHRFFGECFQRHQPRNLDAIAL